MPISVECTTARGVMDWFMDQKIFTYTIYRGVKLDHVADIYDGNDRDEAENKLSRFCNKIEPTNDNVYYLKLEPANKKVKESLPGLVFRLNVETPKFNPYFGMPQQNMIHSDNTEILSRLAAIENSLQDNSEPDEEPDEDNLIGSLLKEPSIKNLLISGIGSILANIITPVPAPVALAGIDETNQNITLQECINTLFSKGVTLQDLIKLSQKTDNEMNMLLNILRS